MGQDEQGELCLETPQAKLRSVVLPRALGSPQQERGTSLKALLAAVCR